MGTETIDAFHERCALFLRSWVGGLEMTGEDRGRFLGGLVTSDVKTLVPGRAVYGFATNLKGRILADVLTVALEDRFWLVLPATEIEAIAAHLGKYAILDRVETTPLAVASWGLVGPTAPRVAAALLGDELDVWSHGEIPDAGGARLLRRPDVAVEGAASLPSYVLLAPGDGTGARERVLRAGADDGVQEASEDDWDVVRVEAGLPRFGRDFGPDHFPQETGLGDAVDYSKGCFLGQEVVARIHYRGGVQRRLRRLVAEVPPSELGGRDVLVDGRSAGTVSSAVRSSRRNATVALAVLHRRAEVGATVEIDGGGEATVLGDPDGDA